MSDGAVGASWPSLPSLRCRVYVASLPSVSFEEKLSRIRQSSPNHLAYASSHSAWAAHHYSSELWLQRALRSHPWTVASASEAELVFIAANFSQACYAAKPFTAMRMWREMLELLWQANQSLAHADAASNPNKTAHRPPKPGPLLSREPFTAPKALSMQYMACRPWSGSVVPHDLLVLSEFARQTHLREWRPSPFVISAPAWLVGTAPPPPSLPWARRKLLFFAGHVPKLSIDRTRFVLWTALRHHRSRVTIASHTINCTIGQFEVCAEGLPALRQRPSTFFSSHCKPYCGANANCHGDPALSSARNARGLWKRCQAYKKVNYSLVMPDIRRDSARRLSSHEYLGEAMSHRFCVVARGDFQATPKITEMVAIGGVGGCLPLFVFTRPLKQEISSSYPYASWLDYCEIGYFVSIRKAARDVGALLDAIEALPVEEIAQKRQALQKLAQTGAFVHRQATMGRPSASDWKLGELCSMAKARKERVGNRTGGEEILLPRGGDYSRCTL